MLIELGHFAMILALALAAAQAFFGLAGAYLQRERWLAVVPSAVTGQFLFLALGTFCLVHAFVINDFSVKYVAEHSNSALPLFYRIAALWGDFCSRAMSASRGDGAAATSSGATATGQTEGEVPKTARPTSTAA